MYYAYQDDISPFKYYFWDIHFKAKTAINPNNILMYSQFAGRDDLFLSIAKKLGHKKYVKKEHKHINC